MTVDTERFTPNRILQLVQAFSVKDLQWLVERLNQLVEDAPLPESATADEAIELYLDDRCSLGRAAELAGVTRWDIMDILAERGTPVTIESHSSIEEIDAFADELEARAAAKELELNAAL